MFVTVKAILAKLQDVLKVSIDQATPGVTNKVVAELSGSKVVDIATAQFTVTAGTSKYLDVVLPNTCNAVSFSAYRAVANAASPDPKYMWATGGQVSVGLTVDTLPLQGAKKSSGWVSQKMDAVTNKIRIRIENNTAADEVYTFHARLFGDNMANKTATITGI